MVKESFEGGMEEALLPREAIEVEDPTKQFFAQLEKLAEIPNLENNFISWLSSFAANPKFSLEFRTMARFAAAYRGPGGSSEAALAVVNRAKGIPIDIVELPTEHQEGRVSPGRIIGLMGPALSNFGKPASPVKFPGAGFIGMAAMETEDSEEVFVPVAIHMYNPDSVLHISDADALIALGHSVA